MAPRWCCPTRRPADAAAARTRVLHALYVTAHAISLATRAETRDLQRTPHALQRRAGAHKLTTLKLIAARIDTFEQIAGAEVYQSFPEVMAGRQATDSPTGQLRTAFAAWEVETHRALVHQPTMANIFEVSRVQAATIAITHLLLDAAGGGGAIDATAYRSQLQPALAAAESAWSELNAVSRELTTTAPRHVGRDLLLAGTQLVHALTQIALDDASVATNAVLSERLKAVEVPATLIQGLESHRDTGQLLMDAVLDPRLTVKADAAQRVLTGLASQARETLSPHEPWIDPRDIALGRQVPLPAPTRGLLIRLVEGVDCAGHRIATATAQGTPAEEQTQKQAQHRTSPRAAPSAVARGPEVTPRVAW